MKTIKLTQGMETWVDDEDYDYLNQWTWQYDSGYAKRTEGRSSVRMHTVVGQRMGLIGQIDHKDTFGLNNQRENLREATHSQNIANSKLSRRNTSGFKGVVWYASHQKWAARIVVNQKQIHLGYFDCKIQAAKKYNHAAKSFFGEFARLNEIPKDDT